MIRIPFFAALATLLAGCAVPGKRGGGAPELTFPASALVQDCATPLVVGFHWARPSGGAAWYRVTRNGTPLVSTVQTSFVDTTVSESTRYSYAVFSVSRYGAPPLMIATAEVVTPPASPGGDPPYCKSQHIESMTWDWDTGRTEPNGSDLWAVTWGGDHKVYTVFGDGGGFGGTNHDGRASFGVAVLDQAAPGSATVGRNLYGGHGSPYPSALQGKGGAIIAVGNDFYTLGGLYTDGEIAGRTRPVSGSPKRRQLAYSLGNAHSWRAAPWFFCSGEQNRVSGVFCPLGFINYGPGNSGAPDGQVYLLGAANSDVFWSGDAPQNGSSTYLARVPRRAVLDKQAYRYFAGLDSRQRPRWSSDPDRMAPVFVDRNAPRPGCAGTCNMAATLGEAVYDRALGLYIGTAQGPHIGQTSFYESRQPWGPWTTISYNNIEPRSGGGGWANLGTAAGESLGVHIVNAWTSPDGLTLWATYSADGTAPQEALFPPAGTDLDSFNLLRLHLDITPARGP
jgi:hypothetical protein